MTDLAERPDLSAYELAGPLPARGRPRLPLRRAGRRPPARRPAAHRPPPRPAHGGVRLRLPGFAGRHVPGGGLGGRGHRARPADRHPARRQRGAGRHRGDGQPARRLAGRQALRRRGRRLVRQGARARPRRRRHPPRRVRRHRPPRRRHGRRRRRPGGQVVDAAELQRRHARRPAHADPVPRRRAGGARPRAATPSPSPGPAASGSASSWSRPSPTAPAPSTCTRTASSRSRRRWSSTARSFVPHPSGRLLTPYTLDMEREFQQVRSELARRYGVANGLNRVTVRRPGRLDRHRRQRPHLPRAARGARAARAAPATTSCASAGVRLFHLLMPVPVDEQQVREFAHGLAEVLVVEEKNPTLELLVKSAMYDSDERPRVVGRHDERGEPLVPGTGMLDADRLLEPLRRRLAARLGDDRLRPLPGQARAVADPADGQPHAVLLQRLPAQLSTRVPEGTLVGGGIGCHAMVALMEPERVGDIAGLTAMGNEGAQWIGMAPFVERDHLVQNIGDGTFFHSGSLAVRAAVAAGVDITYKLLYNGTVAMTGGQDPQGQMTVPDVVQLLLLEGVSRVVVTSDDPDKWQRRRLRPAAPRAGRRARPHRADGDAGRAGRRAGRDRAAARPGVRGREAAGPQPRAWSPSRASGSSSTSGCARAAATAATRATACRCSRSTRRTGARRASTRRAATSTCPAWRATARRSPWSRVDEDGSRRPHGRRCRDVAATRGAGLPDAGADRAGRRTSRSASRGSAAPA